jgi:hypothetical protein
MRAAQITRFGAASEGHPRSLVAEHNGGDARVWVVILARCSSLSGPGGHGGLYDGSSPRKVADARFRRGEVRLRRTWLLVALSVNEREHPAGGGVHWPAIR